MDFEPCLQVRVSVEYSLLEARRNSALARSSSSGHTPLPAPVSKQRLLLLTRRDCNEEDEGNDSDRAHDAIFHAMRTRSGNLSWLLAGFADSNGPGGS